MQPNTNTNNQQVGDMVAAFGTVFGKMQTDITTLQGDMATVKGDITTLQADMTSVKADVSTLKTDMISVKADVSTLKTDMISVKEGVEAIQKILRERNPNLSMEDQINIIRNNNNRKSTEVLEKLPKVNPNGTTEYPNNTVWPNGCTYRTIFTMKRPALREILTYYGLPNNGSTADCRNAVCKHLGVNPVNF